jgi:hypothetical protein
MKKITILMLFLTWSIMADESITVQIEAIKNAPPEQRVEMMNRLKMKIAHMNEEQSAESINAVYGKMKRQRLQNCQAQGANRQFRNRGGNGKNRGGRQ